MMGLIYLAMSLLGWIHFKGFAWQFDPLPVVLGQMLLYLLIFIIVGWQEELLSRGYHLQTLSSGINLFWGVLISSAIFGALHLGNPQCHLDLGGRHLLRRIIPGAGIFRTGQLWLSIGLHIGWNFFEGIVFGFPVSGTASYPLMRISISGPALVDRRGLRTGGRSHRPASPAGWRAAGRPVHQMAPPFLAGPGRLGLIHSSNGYMLDCQISTTE